MADLALARGAWRAQVRAEAGLIGALSHGGVPLLRSMDEDAISPLAAACFAMVPWCNRIAEGRFVWAGREVRLAPNFAPEPHAIHGHGWQARWQVEESSENRCVLVHRHPGSENGGAWPWPYVARQTLTLDGAGCTLSLALTSLAGEAVPAGLGLHPYLRRRAETRLAFNASGCLAVGADMIPTGAVRTPDCFADFAVPGGAPLAAQTTDHCFTGWDGRAAIADDLGVIVLTASGAPFLHLYAPAGSDTLCLEPCSHAPDAMNAGGMPLIAPGATRELALRITRG
ncbi:aldose 1-epimerase [Erythrobacter cryptus]|uniref:aldose 1-epimerase n=1 Tax=Erythrobacter cryptus TaxID=196588 RepID=UPI0004271E33|nr:aldose 1-epimerase [Erythrobacter cryptus]